MAVIVGRRFRGVGHRGGSGDGVEREHFGALVMGRQQPPWRWRRWRGGGVTVTITNPGPQISGTTQSVTLAIRASDSNGGSLIYQATGLPSGLAINTATGAITGSPNTASQTTVQVVATDSIGGAIGIRHIRLDGKRRLRHLLPAVRHEAAGAGRPHHRRGEQRDPVLHQLLPGHREQLGGRDGLQYYANTGDPGPAYSSHWPAERPDVAAELHHLGF